MNKVVLDYLLAIFEATKTALSLTRQIDEDSDVPLHLFLFAKILLTIKVYEQQLHLRIRKATKTPTHLSLSVRGAGLARPSAAGYIYGYAGRKRCIYYLH